MIVENWNIVPSHIYQDSGRASENRDCPGERADLLSDIMFWHPNPGLLQLWVTPDCNQLVSARLPPKVIKSFRQLRLHLHRLCTPTREVSSMTGVFNRKSLYLPVAFQISSDFLHGLMAAGSAPSTSSLFTRNRL